MRGSIQERLECKIERIPECGCWLWTGSSVKNGYGQIWFHGKKTRAHRVTWELSHGPISKGMCVLHKCDTPSCVNPYHLFLGTIKDNSLDCISKGRFYQHGPSGERHGLSKLTKSLVMSIYQAEGTYTEIARKFGISRQNATIIKKKQAWKHLWNRMEEP